MEFIPSSLIGELNLISAKKQNPPLPKKKGTSKDRGLAPVDAESLPYPPPDLGSNEQLAMKAISKMRDGQPSKSKRKGTAGSSPDGPSGSNTMANRVANLIPQDKASSDPVTFLYETGNSNGSDAAIHLVTPNVRQLKTPAIIQII